MPQEALHSTARKAQQIQTRTYGDWIGARGLLGRLLGAGLAHGTTQRKPAPSWRQFEAAWWCAIVGQGKLPILFNELAVAWTLPQSRRSPFRPNGDTLRCLFRCPVIYFRRLHVPSCFQLWAHLPGPLYAPEASHLPVQCRSRSAIRVVSGQTEAGSAMGL